MLVQPKRGSGIAGLAEIEKGYADLLYALAGAAEIHTRADPIGPARPARWNARDVRHLFMASLLLEPYQCSAAAVGQTDRTRSPLGSGAVAAFVCSGVLACLSI